LHDIAETSDEGCGLRGKARWHHGVIGSRAVDETGGAEAKGRLRIGHMPKSPF